MLQLKQVSAQ